MNTYRISKYNPLYRLDGAYLKEEWTDYSDIGNEFQGHILTKEEYVSVENCYLSCIEEILKKEKINCMQILDIEKYESSEWIDKQWISINRISEIIRDCLRNRCWCRLENEINYLHFGYDYYVYLKVNLTYKKVTAICKKYSLFCEKCVSPYIRPCLG